MSNSKECKVFGAADFVLCPAMKILARHDNLGMFKINPDFGVGGTLKRSAVLKRQVDKITEEGNTGGFLRVGGWEELEVCPLCDGSLKQ